MELYYHNNENDEGHEDVLALEFISDSARFGLWFENKEAGWYYVYENMFDDDNTSDDLCGNLDKELLELMYQKIGRILGK
jgi:hypothetical protein